ncbi:MAG TPA: PKD domain-containing protein [Bacteroidales bacterium]|nr:PKD domain-containing protein [Bacteroidales bacterium]
MLIVEFDRAVVNAGTSNGWSITIGGSPVAMVGNPVSAGNNLRIALPYPISYANRNTVLVSHTASLGTLTLTGGVKPNFSNVQAVNNYIAVAADFTNGLYGEIAPKDICAAVTDVEVEFNFTLSKRFRNSIHYCVPQVFIQWQYPAALPRTIAPFNEIGGVGSGIYRAIHTYASYPDNTDNCTWNVSIYPHLWSSGTLQPNLMVTQNMVIIILPNYKRDNGTPVPGTGDLELYPPVDDPRTLFCVGEDITAFRFRDATVFDCQLPVAPDLPNIEPRHVQYVYGTHTAKGIPNVYIDVHGTMVKVTDNNGVAISGVWHVNPDGTTNATGYTTPSGFFEGPVIQYLWDAGTKTLVTPLAQTYPIYHSGDYINDKENDIFDVTLRNWGPCNPYDPMDPFTYNNSVNDFSRLRLVGAPPLPTASDVTVCSGTPVSLSAIRNGTNPGQLHWYNNADLHPGHQVGTGTTYSPGILADGTYNYWVREIGTTGQFCEGPAKQVTVTVRRLLQTPPNISGPTNTCPNVKDLVFSVPHNPPVMSPGGPTRYVWSVPAGLTIKSGQGTRSITVDVGTTVGNKTISVYLEYTSDPSCNSNPSTIQLTVFSVNHNPGTIRGSNICSGEVVNITNNASASTGNPSSGGLTYSWERAAGPTFSVWTPLTGSSATFSETISTPGVYRYRRTATFNCGDPVSTTRDITVFSITHNGGAISGTDICQGGTVNITNQTSAFTGTPASSGPTYSWHRAPGPAFSSWTLLSGSSATFSEIVNTPGTYRYRRTATFGCGNPRTAIVDITVNPLPAPVISGETSPCHGNTKVYTTQYHDGHNYSWSVVNGTISGSSTGNSVTVIWNLSSGTGSLRVTETIQSSGCAVTTPNYNITINPAAPGAAGAITGLSNMCYAQTGVTYSILPVANASNYVWSVPAGVNIVSGQGTTSLKVDFTSAAVSPVTISVYPENGCGAGGTSSRVITIYPELEGGSIGGDQTICYGYDVAAFTSSGAATGGAGSFSYLWQYTTDMSAPLGSSAWQNISSATGLTYDHGTLTGTTRFVRRAVEGTCSTPVYSNIVTVTVRPQLNGGSIGSDQTICYGADVAAFTSSGAATGGAGSFSYLWQYTTDMSAPLGSSAWQDISSATGLIYDHGTLTGTTRFVRRAVEGTCSTPVYSNIVRVTVRPELKGGLISGNQTICYGTIPAQFTNSTAASGGAGSFTYSWWYTTDAGLDAGDPGWNEISSSNTTGFNYNNTLTTTTRFVRRAVDGTCTTPVYSNIVTVTVRPQLDGGEVGTSQTVCYGNDVPGFTSKSPATGGEGSFTYTWQYTTNMLATPGDGNWTDIGSSNSVTYDHGNLTTTTKFVRKAVESTCSPVVYSNEIIITVMPALNSGVIGSSHFICYGEAPNPFSSLVPASGGGGSFTYTWQYTTNTSAVAGDGNWTDIANSDDEAYTHGVLTATTLFVRKAEDASCTTPVYSNIITVTINPLPVTSLIRGPSVLCEDATNRVYEVDNHPGSTYTWTVPSSMVITSPPGMYFIIVDAVPGMAAPGDTITVTETILSTGCVGKPVKLPVSVVPIIPGVVVNGPASLCLGDTAVYSVPFNSGSTYTWSYPAGAYIISAPNSHSVEITFKMAGTGVVSVIENSNGVCNTIHIPLNVTVNPLPAIFNLSAPVAYCSHQSGVTITLSGSQTGVNYQLYNSTGPVGAPLAGTGSSLAWADNENETYYVIATNATTGCEQLMNGTVTPVVNYVSAGQIGTDHAVCENASPDAFTSITAGTGSGAITYQWQRSTDNSTWTNIPGATSLVYASGPVSASTYFRRMAISTLGSSVCEDPSNSILVTLITFNPGSIGSDISICEGTAPGTAFTSVPPTGTGTFTYRWLSSTDGINYSFTGITDETYTPGVLYADTWFKREVTATYLTRSCVKETNAVKVTVINFSPGSIGSDQTICEGTVPASFTSVAASGDGTFTYSWESSSTGTGGWVPLGVTTPAYSSPALSADTYFRRAVTATHGGTSCTLYTNTILVKVNSFDAGTIGPPQTICENTAPSELATVISASADPAATMTYQWQSSSDGTNYSSISGATGENYTSGTLLTDTWFRRQVTVTLNGRTCTGLTPGVLIKVNNLSPGSIEGTQTVCEGEIPAPFTETAAAVADGTTVAYQWQESTDGSNFVNVAPGGNNATYAPPAPLAGDTWFKRIVTSTLDGVGCLKESNVIKVTVINFDPGSIAGDQSICENSPAAPLTSVSPSGDGTFTYRWKMSTDGTDFVQIGATGETYNPGILTQDTWYKRIVRSALNGKTCLDSTNFVKITVLNFTPGSITGNQIICEGAMPDAFGSVPAMGDGTFTYEWKMSTNGITYTPIPSSDVEIYTPPAGLTADTWFKRSVTSTDGIASCVLETNPIKVTVINFSPGAIASDQTICEGKAPAPFTSVAASGDGTMTYQWQISTDGLDFTDINLATGPTYASPALTADTWFRRISTATIDTKSCSEPTNEVFVNVITFDPGKIGSNQTICQGETPAPLVETDPASGEGTFTYLWQSSHDGTNFNNITGATGMDYAPGPLTQNTWFRREVTATLNGRACRLYTDPVIVRVNRITPGTITGTQTICEGDTPAQLTGTAATSDFGHLYQWQESTDEGINWDNVPSGGNAPDYSPPSLNTDTWYRRLVISTVGITTCEEESNVVRVTVINFDPGAIEEDQVICENTPAALITSITPTGDGIFSYRWFRRTEGSTFTQIGGALGETFNPGILTEDTWYYREVKATLNGKECYRNTNEIEIIVNNLTPGSISDDQTVCEGEDPVPLTTGTSPTFDGPVSYRWQSSTDGINFADIIGATDETYDPPVLDQDTWFRRAVTSTIGLNACTKYSNHVRITVINFTPGSIGSSQTICEGSAPAAFTSVAASGDGAKTYQWQFSTDSINYINVPMGGTGATYSAGILTQDTWFRRLATAEVNHKLCVKISDTVKITVINFDPGSISGDQVICENDTPAPFASSADALGDGVISYQWQASLDGTNYTNITGATGNIYAPGPLAQNTWFRRQATATLNGRQCILYTVPVMVEVNRITPGSISGTQTICEGDIPAPFTSVAATGDGIITYQWQESADNGGSWHDITTGGDVEIYVAPELDADMWYKRIAKSTKDGTECSRESNVIMVTVNNFDPGNIAADQTICENTAPLPFTSITPTGDGVFSYRWFRSTDGHAFSLIPTAVGETYSPGVLTQDTWYYREVTSTLGTKKCIAGTDTILVRVNNFDPGDIDGTQTICEGTAPAEFKETAAAASYDGALISYQWQESSDGFFFTDIPGADGVTYSAPSPAADTWYRRAVKATLGTNECTGYSSIIKVTVINFVPGSIGSDRVICEGSSPAAFTSVPAGGDGAKTYQWQFSTDSINYTDVLAGGTGAAYSAGPLTQDTWFRRLSTATIGSVSCTKITDTIKVTVINFDPGTVSPDQTICEGDIPAEIISPAATGDGTFAYQWQSSTNGTSFSSINGATDVNYAPGALMVDTWFRRQVTATVKGMSCIDLTPAVRITVNNLNPGSVTGAQTICKGAKPAALTSVTPGTGDGSNITYQWQESADNGTSWADVPSDGDGADYSPPSLTADMLYRRVTLSELNGITCTKESNIVKITVINFDPGQIGHGQTICEGTAPDALTSSVPPSGDGSFTYRWFRSTDDITYNPVPGALNETYSPGILTQDTWFYREVTATLGSGSCPAVTNKVLITVNNFLPGSLDADQTICEGDKPAVIGGVSPSGDGMNYTYQWYESADGTVFTEITGATDETFDPPVLNADTWYKRAVTSHLNGNECTRETAPERIWVINFVPGTIGEDQTICDNTAPLPFTGTAPTGDGTFTFSWEYSLDGSAWHPVPGINTATYAAPVLTADTWYRRIVTSELNSHTCSKATAPVRVTVINFVPGSISTNQTICEGDTPAPFGSIAASGDGTFTYQWQSSINGSDFSNIVGETDETYAAGPLMADTWYRRQVTAELNGRTCSAVTTAIRMTVNNVTAGAIGSDQIICEGTAPLPLTSVTPVYDGDVTYEWQSSTDGSTFITISGAEDETYSPPVLYADTWYKRIVTSTLNSVACWKESNVVRITVNNFDPGSISGDQTICEGTAPAPVLSVTPTGDGVFSYRWFSSTDGTGYNLIIGAVSETYNPGVLIQDTWYKREVTSRLGTNICIVENDPVKITVNNLDPGVVTGDVTICEGDIPSVITGTDATGDGDITYQWRISNDGVNYTDIITDGDGKDYAPGPLFQDTWFLRTVTSDYYGQRCTEISGSFRVIVNNVNPGTIISDQTICLGGDPVPFISIVHGSGKGNITYEWESSIDNSVWNPIAGSNTPGYDSPVLTQDTWFRRITRSDHGGTVCEKISNIVKVTVNEVYGGAIEKDQPICFGSAPAPLTSANDGGGTGTVSYQWQRSADGVIWNTISGETGKTYAPGVLYSDTWYKRVLISIENGVLCQAESDPVKITVNSLPVAILTGGETICDGDPATLSISITNGTAPYEVYIENHGTETINGPDADILVYPSSTTTYRILSVRDVNGCDAVNMIGNATVIVRDLPHIVTEPVDRAICEYGVLNFSVVATGSDLDYQWYVDRQDGNGFVTLTDAGIFYGVQTPVLNLFGVTRDMDGYVFRVTVSTCGVTRISDDVNLTVNTAPEIQEQPKDTTICTGDDAEFLILATGTNLTYKWQYKPPSGSFTDIVNGGIYTVTDSILTLTDVPLSFNNYFFRVIVSGKCGSPLYSNFVVLRVNGPPKPVVHPNDRAVCDGGGPVFFTGNGTGLIDSLRWQVSTDNGINWDDIYDNAHYAGTTTQQLSIIDINYDDFHNNRYRLALKAFCATAYTNAAVLTVNRLPVVSFTDDPIPACGDVPLVITPVITGGTAPWKSHSWTGDIGPLNNYFSPAPTFRTRIAGTYDLTYRVVDDNMCAGEGSVSVVVDAPDATFTQDISMACTPATVKFSKDMTGMKSWEWNFGDGTPVNTTDENPVHVFTNTTSTAIVYRTIKLTVESMAGCYDTKTSMMTVYPAVIAHLTASDDVVCHGNQIVFTADPGANIYMWDFGDGTPRVPGVNTSTHMFTNLTGTPVTRTVKVVTTSMYGCSDSTTMDIVVMPMPLAQFSATPNNQTYDAVGNKVVFTDETTPVSTWTYHWDFGDGGSSTLQHPEHTFTGTGTYNVVLTVTNGKCTSTISHPVHILPLPPVADFDSIPSGCATWTITPNNTSLNTEMPGTTYRWDFGDGSYSTAKNPSYTYFKAGEYRVELTVTGPGGMSVKSQVVRAYPSPRAYFEVSPTLVFVNDERVRCFNLTEGGDYFVWEFGDGDTSRMREPYHKYMEEGVYDITLWAYNNDGCRDVFVLSPGVTVQPAGDVRFSTVFRPNPTGPIERSDLPTGGNEIDQFFFPPIRDKVIKYKLQVFNRLGVLIFESHDINVPWNGYYKGQLCPQGVYVWYVEGKYANGQPFKKVGDITLLH